MVTNVTSFSRSGLSDFLVQRISAVVLAVYTLCLTGFFLANPDLDHAGLVAFFGSGSMVAFTTLSVFALAAHAWIGMWTVGTDYLRPAHFGKSATVLRFIYWFVCLATLALYVMWALKIVWGL